MRDLAQTLHTRIEMKQIGNRDETKLLGGVGPCGRELCCSSWLREFSSVSVKMAKEQGLSLNPSKLAGMCGRLKCCLRYEYDTYLELGRALPAVGKPVESVKGNGVVTRQNVLKQTVLIRRDEDGVEVEARLEDLVERRSRRLTSRTLTMPPIRSTSPRRSTTSTPSPTSGTRTRPSSPTRWRAWHRARGDDTLLVTGTDEHGDKIAQAAAAAGVDARRPTPTGSATLFRDTWDACGISYDHFIRTTDDYHVRTVQDILRRIARRAATSTSAATAACTATAASASTPRRSWSTASAPTTRSRRPTSRKRTTSSA